MEHDLGIRRGVVGLLFMLVLTLASTLLGGCRDRESHELVVIPHKVSGSRWLSERVGVEEAAEQRGLSVNWSGPNDSDSVDEQSEIADQAIHRNAVGILLSPNRRGAFRRQLLEASARHIPVVLMGDAAGMGEAPGVSLVLSNLQQTGQLIAARLGQILHHKGHVLIAGLDPHVAGNVERSDAIIAALESSEPGIHVVDRVVASTSPTHAETLVYQAVTTRKDIDAVVSLSAEESVAAASALHEAAGLERIKIIGCDQSLPLFMLLHFGLMDSLLVQDDRRQGRLAVETVQDMRAARFSSRTVLVDPALVTRDNIQTEVIQQMLLMHR